VVHRASEVAVAGLDHANRDPGLRHAQGATPPAGLIGDGPQARARTPGRILPIDIVPELADHLEHFAAPGPRGLVFLGPKEGRLRHSNFRKFWNRARDAIDMPEPPFTICGTGNTTTAAEEASLRELMERMDHSSPRAALIYPRHPRARQENREGHGPGLHQGQERIGHSAGPQGHGGGVSTFDNLC
jgi:hypothetical protein